MMKSTGLFIIMSYLLRTTIAVVGLCGAGSILYNRCLANKPPPEHNKELIHLAAVALSSEVVDTVIFRNEESLKLLRGFVKKVFLHPDVVHEIKTHVVSEFTTNKETVAALRKFIVEDIIRDTWVADELISMAKETGKEIVHDRTIYPDLSLKLLADATQEGLRTSTFKEALKSAVKGSLWQAFLGPPPPHLTKGVEK
ncbi:uncharacterized protein TM35_000071960 [Trypanosoma theileri]|uniref:Uncharacterized protein n=1 Tax=Trypanosoma theileri TaxID=67003 RepID=A0A1X0P1H2_9TRYP|nr:uncharacterized protein TM35_000071960 [Trypanosoma theileri]ORC90772.1 hypothetical protein TM35_000071960 [Trypanosoma theileri]